MKIAIGNDHTAVELKNIIKQHLENNNHEVVDFGVNSTTTSNYAEVAHLVSKEIQNGNFENGILICGTGIGISIAANKHKGIRAAACSEPYSAKLSKMHNNSNVLAFGARVVGSELAKMIVDEWINAKFEGERHKERLNTITKIEQNELA